MQNNLSFSFTLEQDTFIPSPKKKKFDDGYSKDTKSKNKKKSKFKDKRQQLEAML